MTAFRGCLTALLVCTGLLWGRLADAKTVTFVQFSCGCDTNGRHAKKEKCPGKPGVKAIVKDGNNLASRAATRCHNSLKKACSRSLCAAKGTEVGRHAFNKEEQKELEEWQRFKKRFEKKNPNATADIPPDFERDWGKDWASGERAYREAGLPDAFAGVYDPTTGSIVMRPSSPSYDLNPDRPNKFENDNKDQKNSWVRRNGGHEQLADVLATDWIERMDGVYAVHVDERKELFPKLVRAFTVTKTTFHPARATKGKHHFQIKWKSEGVNGKGFLRNTKPRFKGDKSVYELPDDYRKAVILAVYYHMRNQMNLAEGQFFKLGKLGGRSKTN